jgi:hypothetical protein
MMGYRRSRRERDASTQSAHVESRASAGISRGSASSPPTRPRRLSEGVQIEASVMARLLRWRVLTLDASVLLLPASAPATQPDIRTTPPDAWSRRATKRGCLADAIKNIDEAQRRLANARQAGHAAVPGPQPQRPKGGQRRHSSGRRIADRHASVASAPT